MSKLMGRQGLMAGIWAASLSLAAPALAQNYNQLAPPVLKPPQAPQIAVPPPPAAPPGSPLVIVPRLLGIRLVGAPSLLVPAGVSNPGVSGEDVAFGPQLSEILSGFIGAPASMATLNTIEARIILLYRAEGHPFVDVVLPPQNIATGVVQYLVFEYRVGAVTVRDNHWFSSAQIKSALRVKPGQTIDINRVESDLAWLNENPFRRVDLLASPGAVAGTTNLNLVVHDQLPLAATIGFDNAGNALTGDDRWKLGLLTGNVLGRGILLGYQFTTSDDFLRDPHLFASGTNLPRYLAHSLSLTIPLASRDTIRIFGDYERVVPRLPSGFVNVGHSGQASLRFDHPLPDWHGLIQQISLGYDYKTSDNNIAFGGTTVSTSSAEIDQFPITYSATLRDHYGQTTLVPQLVLSPGGLTGGNNNSAFQPGANNGGTYYARADYIYARLDVERLTALPRGFVWRARLTAQVASSNLLPSEQLSIGGFGSVRGYPTDVAGGSEGVVIGNELRAPPFTLLSRISGGIGPDALRPDIFFDYAHVFDVKTQPGNPASTDLASLGLGANYTLGTMLSLDIQAGVQFHPIPGHTNAGSFINVDALATF